MPHGNGITPAPASDKHQLYAQAFQNPDSDLGSVEAIFTQEYGRPPVSVREDFCGTAANCVAWVRSGDNRFAAGIDIDAETLAWCRKSYVDALRPDEQRRLRLCHGDVLEVETTACDVILALNCSFCVLKTRKLLNRYVEQCLNRLPSIGMLVLEVYAGPEAQRSGSDRIACETFTAIWEQVRFNAVTNEALNRIHFELEDGSRLENAFEYDWRLWSPAELLDILSECGFSDARVYRKDMTDGRDLDKSLCNSADVSDYWVVYIVGLK